MESQGAKVVVHEPGSMPLPGSEAISVAAQLDTELGLSLVRSLVQFDILTVSNLLRRLSSVSATPTTTLVVCPTTTTLKVSSASPTR